MNFTEAELLSINPDILGELLLHQFNPEHRWGYKTLDSNELIKKNITPSLLVRTILCGSFAKDEKEFSRISCFSNFSETLWVYLYWDGDGCIVIERPNKYILYNGDIKCAHCWEEITENDVVYSLMEDDEYYEVS